MGTAADGGRLVDAVRAFASWICTDEEVAALERTAFFERWATGVPAMLRFVEGDAGHQGPRSTDPKALAQVAVPVLLLQGQRTRIATWFSDAVEHIARHVATSQACELPGVGHPAPVLAPESIVDELVTFFESVRAPARRHRGPGPTTRWSVPAWQSRRGRRCPDRTHQADVVGLPGRLSWHSCGMIVP